MADVVLDAAGVVAGERVLDVACGTGNAALAAAARGARAVGVDGAEGLVALARERADEAGVEVRFRLGDAGGLPVDDGTFDAVVSVFGVIFAPDPLRAARELLRAARPGGRVVLSSWIPTGPIHDVGRILFTALPPAPGEPRHWGEPAWTEELLLGAGAEDVEIEEGSLTFTDGSPDAWFAEQEEHHPVWRWGRRILGEERWAGVREESVAALAAANESPDAFRATSRYLVVLARQPTVGRGDDTSAPSARADRPRPSA